MVDGHPIQQIDDAPGVSLEINDLSALDDAKRAALLGLLRGSAGASVVYFFSGSASTAFLQTM